MEMLTSSLPLGLILYGSEVEVTVLEKNCIPREIAQLKSNPDEADTCFDLARC